MDGFVFYVILIIVTALLSMSCSCLWRYFRNRTFAAYHRHQMLRAQEFPDSHTIIVGAAHPLFSRTQQQSGYLQQTEVVPNAVPAAPPAYSEVVSNSAVYPNRVITADDFVKTDDLPPSYNQVLSEQQGISR